MSFINDKTKEINCKIVYYGPPRSGKSTTLRKIYEHARQESKVGLVSLNEGDERTLYFDFVPLNLGKIKNYTVRLHLYTVPGEIGYKSSRELTSKGLDGVVFVADSQLTQVEANIASLKSLKEILVKEGHDPVNLPMVFQYNKRDLSTAVPAKELSTVLNTNGFDEFESVATTGQGVFEVLQSIAKKVLLDLKRQEV
ncbi:MAG: GTPase domain-containing protein [Deltaproteobacteria bacterium]|nr:GTPase domain-containing protein [Deltaproteobacteria bacterium]